MKRNFVLVICAILSLALLLGGCTIKEDSEESLAFCKTFLDYVIQNNYDAAYAMASHVASEDDFSAVWNEMRNVLQNSKSYEIQQTGWYRNTTDGVTTTEVLFEVVSDDGKVCQIRIYTTDGVEGISGLHFLDSTEFVQKTAFIPILNIFLGIFSLACLAFGIWMFVDCLKRKLRYKILWAIITWIYAGISLTVGATGMNFTSHFLFLIPITKISSNPSTLAITASVFVPLGAIVYFFMRKRLTISEEVKTEISNEIPKQTES